MSFQFKFLTFAILLNCLIYATCDNYNVDPNGYIVFCPCMGRFGNQIEQFIGSLAFAKDLGRTLVLPHLIEYPDRFATSVQIPFQKYLKVEPLSKYTKVILMDDFMKHIAPTVWPKGNRTVFCYSFREGETCSAKDGNPFGPYWDRFDIDFDRNENFGPLGYDLSFPAHEAGWKAKYPSSAFPVLAFVGAPGSFPVLEKHVELQKYIRWSDAIEKKAAEFIAKIKSDPKDKVLGIHMRNNIDFKQACEHTRDLKYNFFASAQCLGYNMEYGVLTPELCYPSDNTVLKQLGDALEKTQAKVVYIASDQNHMIATFEKKFKNIKFVKYDSNNPHVDLCILGKVDHAIVNCVSTFSAFVKRQRDADKKTTEFWAFEPKKSRTEL